MRKYRAGQWVTIIKVNYIKDVDPAVKDYYDKYIGRAFPVIIHDSNNLFTLPIKDIITNDENTWWSEDEVRLATKKEIRLGELMMGAEKI